jgi:hypothetical protein
MIVIHSLGTIFARSAKIAKQVIDELPSEARSKIDNEIEFIVKLKKLIQTELMYEDK